MTQQLGPLPRLSIDWRNLLCQSILHADQLMSRTTKAAAAAAAAAAQQQEGVRISLQQPAGKLLLLLLLLLPACATWHPVVLQAVKPSAGADKASSDASVTFCASLTSSQI